MSRLSIEDVRIELTLGKLWVCCIHQIAKPPYDPSSCSVYKRMSSSSAGTITALSPFSFSTPIVSPFSTLSMRVSQFSCQYSTEKNCILPLCISNRGDRIWTYGHSLPKRVLYQTELHPVVVVPIAANPELPRGSPQPTLDLLMITHHANKTQGGYRRGWHL